MSKYSESLEKQLKDIKALKDATKSVIKGGGKIAMEEIHHAGSLKKLKEGLR